jgi:CubicO group peptidase (beta-lactamase class C family)
VAEPAPTTEAAPAAPTTVTLEDPAKLDCGAIEELLGTLISDHWTPSVALAVVRKDAVTFCNFGLVHGAPPTPQTGYELGSITKVFTGLLLAQRVVAGRVRLDQPAATLAPDLRWPTYAGQPIRLVDLGTHTSGLPRQPDNLRGPPGDPYAGYSYADLGEYLSRAHLRDAPGQHYAYSNLGAELLGNVLTWERKDYAAALQSEVLVPLGLARTWVWADRDDDDLPTEVARGHDADGTPVRRWHYGPSAPAGALISTTEDLARFVRAELKLEHTPLDAALELAAKPIRTEAGASTGLFVQVDGDGVRWHTGQTSGFRSFVAWDPEHRFGVVLLANSSGYALDGLGRKLVLLLQGRSGVTPLLLPKAVALPMEALSQYEGRYRLNSASEIRVFARRGRLWAKVTDQAARSLTFSGNDGFHYRLARGSIRFERDSSGRVVALVLRRGANSTRAKRRGGPSEGDEGRDAPVDVPVEE